MAFYHRSISKKKIYIYIYIYIYYLKSYIAHLTLLNSIFNGDALS